VLQTWIGHAAARTCYHKDLQGYSDMLGKARSKALFNRQLRFAGVLVSGIPLASSREWPEALGLMQRLVGLVIALASVFHLVS